MGHDIPETMEDDDEHLYGDGFDDDGPSDAEIEEEEIEKDIERQCMAQRGEE